MGQHRPALIFLLIGAALSSFGCQALQNLADAQKPNLSVQEVRVTDFAFDEIELTFDVRVENPNPFELQLQSYTYDFNINGNTFIEGTREKGLAIAATDTSIIHVPVELNFGELYDLFNSLKDEDSADYKLFADLTFNLPVLGETTIPLKKTGTVPLLQLPEIRVAGLQVIDANFSDVDLKLNIAVQNPNGFALFLNGFSYQFEVNNQEWLDTRFTNDVTVSENSIQYISIPISLNTLNIGASVIDLLQNAKDLEYSFEGNIDVAAGHPLLGDTDFSFYEEGQLPVMIQ